MITALEARKRSDKHTPITIWMKEILEQIDKSIQEACDRGKYWIRFEILPEWIVAYSDENGFIPIDDILTTLRDCGYEAEFYNGDGKEKPLYYLYISWKWKRW